MSFSVPKIWVELPTQFYIQTKQRHPWSLSPFALGTNHTPIVNLDLHSASTSRSQHVSGAERRARYSPMTPARCLDALISKGSRCCLTASYHDSATSERSCSIADLLTGV